jgi:hypothetical protein
LLNAGAKNLGAEASYLEASAWKVSAEALSSESWYREPAADIREKKLDYMRRWNTADAEQRAELTLPASDGI